MTTVNFKTTQVETVYNELCDRDPALEDALEWLLGRLASDRKAVRSRDYTVDGVGTASLSTAGVANETGYVAVVWRLEGRAVMIYGAMYAPGP
jgi:hypothetical protein